jgi:enoyl-CoA hydratase/carnithine racemase
MGTAAVERIENVLVVRLETAPLGLMDASHIEALAEVSETADRDAAIGGVVVTGTHPTRFVAHYDVSEVLAAAEAAPALSPEAAHRVLRVVAALRRLGLHRALMRTAANGAALLERMHEVFSRISTCSAVWVAAINGSALGGGCELALACDLRLMASGEGTVIGQPDIMLGFPPGGGGTQRLARLVGARRALRIVLDGRPLTPDEAFDVGIVDEVVPAEGLLARAIAEASRLGARPKAAIGACKRAVYFGGAMRMDDGLRLERAEFLSALGTKDAMHAMRAYVDAARRAGDLPAYDPNEVERALDRGRFG